MDFIPVTANIVPTLVVLAVTVGLCIVMGLRLSSEEETPGDATITVNVVVGFATLVSFIALIVLFIWNAGQYAIRAEGIGTKAQETYGIFLSDDDRKNLDYPADRPESSFQRFGSFQRDNGEEAVLVWKVNEFQLGTMNGKKFVEFERVD